MPDPGTNHPLHGYTKRQKLEVEWLGRKYELPGCTVASGFVRTSERRDRERLGTGGHLFVLQRRTNGDWKRCRSNVPGCTRAIPQMRIRASASDHRVSCTETPEEAVLSAYLYELREERGREDGYQRRPVACQSRDSEFSIQSCQSWIAPYLARVTKMQAQIKFGRVAGISNRVAL